MTTPILSEASETKAREELADGHEAAGGTPTGTRTLSKVLGRDPDREE